MLEISIASHLLSQLLTIRIFPFPISGNIQTNRFHMLDLFDISDSYNLGNFKKYINLCRRADIFFLFNFFILVRILLNLSNSF